MGANLLAVKKITSSEERSEVCDKILRSLPKWFGIESSIVDYVKDVRTMETWASYSNNELTGFISVNKHNTATAEIHVIGVLEAFHKKGVGKLLIYEAEKYLVGQKFKYLTVKTLSELRADENYEKTRHFYLAMGFAPVEVFKTLWGEHNPCLLMIKSIESINSATKLTEGLIPTLQTNRLILRPFNLEDSKEVQRQAGSPSVAATTTTIPHPYPDGAAEEWISKHQGWFKSGISVDFAITLKTTSKLVGNISLMINKSNQKAEIGYWLGEEHWNNGYCTEAMKKVIEYAFNVKKLNKITCRHMMTNPSSGKVMIKSGLNQEGYLKQELLKNGQFYDTIVYGLLKCEWDLK
jgi:RimJ/RimL family protein N-acetyltransferase/GNAT superfamily N-acetyltransferase